MPLIVALVEPPPTWWWGIANKWQYLTLRSQGKSFLAERNEEAVNENLNMKALPPYWPTFDRYFLHISGFCIMESLSLFTRLRFGGRWYAFYGFTPACFF